MGSVWKNLRHGARTLVKQPEFTLIAVLALALGIGANTAIFSVVPALLPKPLSFPAMDRVVAIWDESQQSPRNEVAAPNYPDWQAQSQSYEHLAMYRGWIANLTGIEEPERVQGYLITANLIDALGLPPMLGRNFRPEENEPGKDKAVILTHDLWQRRFGNDPDIVGRSVTLNGVARTVVGVMPAGFNFPRDAEVLAPLVLSPELKSDRSDHSYMIVGRLKAGVDIQQAQAELNMITARLARQYPDSNTGLGARIHPLPADTVRLYQVALIVLMSAVGLVLLIACANVANLTLARTANRTRELAIRAAPNTGRFSPIRRLITESVFLAVIGGALGVLFALWGVELLKASLSGLAFQFAPLLSKLEINYSVLGFTLGLSLLVGLAPVWQTMNAGLNESLKEGGKGGAGAGHYRSRSELAVVEAALSLISLAGTGLIRSLKDCLRWPVNLK